MPDDTPQVISNMPVSAPSSGGRKIMPWLVAGGVVVILVIGLIVVLLMHHKSNSGSGPASTTALQYDRPGFDRTKLAGSVGDPAALQLKSSNTAITYQNTKVVQACNILSPADFAANNLKLAPNGLISGVGSIRRQFIDEQGTGSLAAPLTITVTPDSDLNNCEYDLYTGSAKRSGVDVAVYQLFDASNDGLTKRLSQYYTKSSPVNGFDVYIRKADSSASLEEYVILSGGQGASVHLSFADEAINLSQKAAIVQAAAVNLKKELATPSGPAQPTYDSPTYPKKFVRACDLLNAGDVQAVANRPVSPFVDETLPTGTGIVSFGAGHTYNFIETKCARSTADPSLAESGPTAQTLTVQVTAFRDTDGATHYLQAERTDGYHKSVTSQQVGDDGFSATYVTGNQIIFRKGRVVVTVGGGEKLTAQQLLPVVQKIAGRMQQ